MILHDRVTVTTKGALTGEDPYGGGVYAPDVTSEPIPAEIEPVNSDETMSSTSDAVVTTYRLTIRGGVQLDTTSTITWRGLQYVVQGDVQPFVVNGRVHHQEALIRRYSG